MCFFQKKINEKPRVFWVEKDSLAVKTSHKSHGYALKLRNTLKQPFVNKRES